MSLTHRERVRTVLSGRAPDRPVVDLGGFVCSFSKEAYLDLKAHLGFGTDMEEAYVTFIGTVGRLDERVLQHFDIPFRRVYPRPGSSFTI